jgi:hypothetical protein
MSRYSTWWVLSNCKNSLKSGGRLTVAIVQSPQDLNGLQALPRGLGVPIHLVV